MFDIEKERAELAEKTLESHRVYDGVILHLDRDDIELPNGHKATRESIRHIGAVCVMPVTENDEIILERQYRYPIDEVITELPAGKLDSKDEDYLLAGQRELLEETGITAEEWIDLGFFYPAAAYSDEKIKMYIAKGLKYGKSRPDEDELIDVVKIPFDEALHMVMAGEIPDSKTQIAILKYSKIKSR